MKAKSEELKFKLGLIRIRLEDTSTNRIGYLLSGKLRINLR